MLERVSVGQVRFNVPGLAPDNRGVAVGRQMALRFAAPDRMVSFLRLWSREQSLDDLQPGLRIMRARSTGGTRELLMLVTVASAASADRLATAARAAGGGCFTGAGRHFVQFRDGRAPLGYDVDVLATEAADVILYGEDLTLAYTADGQLALDKILLGLQLVRLHGARPPSGDELFLTARRGLGPMVIEYLHRVQHRDPELRAWAALCDRPSPGLFQRAGNFWLFRLEAAPERLVKVLSGTPGLELFVPLAENLALAAGYRHPVNLASSRELFPGERLFLFSPGAAGVTVLEPRPNLAPLADLVRLREPWTDEGGRAASEGRGPRVAATAVPVGPVELRVALRLEPAPADTSRATAALIPWSHAAWLRSVVYLLPPPAIAGHRIAMLERGILIVAGGHLEGFPFGRLLASPAPGLLVPLGMELRPAISPDQLAGTLGGTGGSIVVFPGPGEAPFLVPSDALVTLEAQALSEPRLAELVPPDLLTPSAGATSHAQQGKEIEIENGPLGAMPLWRL